ncbi:hypothetical protein GCM10010260_41590 [Streptomyces filipinensis]|uniref:Uncharacterized protein n=1 Tax=Streptomyces filipinensis TaxID=66887 RepID=A0A918IC92_9ACTN|nr:hypothetical protein [Streptomyces filipinensis]GGV00698.1 hypothetical protein GCM10010260_41590 [Streptomyces filipinensis]
MRPSPFDPPDPRFVTTGEHPLWDEALAAVNRDLAATLPEQRPLCLVAYPGWERAPDETERVHVALANGDAHGDCLWPEPSAAGALRAVAEAAQDTVMELLWQAWPVCTLHGLGMHVTEDAGRPSWWCAGGSRPGDPAHVRAAIGEMDTVHRPRRPNRKRRKDRGPR